MFGKLYLIPITLGDCSPDSVIPSKVSEIIRQLNYFIVENIRTSRRYIRSVDKDKNIDDLTFFVLNKHTQPSELNEFLAPIQKGYDVGVISEAGVPGVADPGASIVSLAHQKGIAVVPLVGPSSILLALMASGMNGQKFAFHGYLPIKDQERIQTLKKLEKQSRQTGETQIFMETPYRNNKLFADILKACQKNTLLCVASNITLKNEQIQTKPIAKWIRDEINLHKLPTVFLIDARNS